MELLYYWIHLDERGEFFATIENKAGDELVKIDTEYAQFLADEGVKLHNTTSLWKYFRSMEIIPQQCIVTKQARP